MIQNSPRLGKALSSIVTNPDGSKATPDQIFKAVDTDGDGKISVDELKGAMKTAHSHMHGHHGGPPPVSDDSSSDDSSNTSTSGISSTVNQIFQLLDTDGDGQVSSTELSAAMSNLSAASGTTNSSDSSSSSSSSSDSGSSTSSPSGASAVSTQTASLQALLQQLMVQIQQQQAAYTQNGSSTEAGAMPSFFKVSA
jgi:Ca2+-binding EF-hand superfamily protein